MHLLLKTFQEHKDPPSPIEIYSRENNEEIPLLLTKLPFQVLRIKASGPGNDFILLRIFTKLISHM